jgi:hypothetical protein
MAGRIYTATFQDVTVAALQDLFEILADATCVVELMSLKLSQRTLTGDAAEEMLRIAIQGHTGAFTSGSGGTVPGEIPVELGNAAAVTIVEANNTTEISGGTTVVHEEIDWNVRVPLEVYWPPEERYYAAPTDAITVTILGATPTSQSMSGTVKFREIGGS